jgi:hypothetical protein
MAFFPADASELQTQSSKRQNRPAKRAVRLDVGSVMAKG